MEVAFFEGVHGARRTHRVPLGKGRESARRVDPGGGSGRVPRL